MDVFEFLLFSSLMVLYDLAGRMISAATIGVHKKYGVATAFGLLLV